MGGGTPSHTSSSVTQSNLPEYAQPYFTGLLETAGGVLSEPYTSYSDVGGGERIAGFTPEQVQTQQQIMGMGAPGQFGTATDIATAASQGALGAGQYQPQMVGQPTLQQYQMGAPQDVTAMQQTAPQMATAQTGFAPQLQQYQMAAPEKFTGLSAQEYMSPYMQNVVDVQKQQAIRDAQQAQLAANLGAARQGTYGGARQLLATTERERNLQQNLANIQAQGLQSAYQQAAQQFGADREALMRAQQANQQAALGVQQLGTQTGLQAALANLSAEQQANVQNQAAQLQQMGLNQQQALQAALANQQMGYNVGQQNLNAALQTQQLGTQAGLQALLANQQAGLQAQQLGLQGYGQALQGAQTLGQLGGAQQQANLQRLAAQGDVGAQLQQLQQQYLSQQYQDFLQQRYYPVEQLSLYSNILRGLPIQNTGIITQATPAPSMLSQLAGAGLGAAGLSRLYGG